MKDPDMFDEWFDRWDVTKDPEVRRLCRITWNTAHAGFKQWLFPLGGAPDTSELGTLILTHDVQVEKAVRKHQRISADEIVDRAARKAQTWADIRRWCAVAGFVILVGITEPVHTWLRAHIQFVVGMVVGSLLQVPGWLRDKWKDRPTHEEFPGGDSCGDDALLWPSRKQ